jgi:hypothetical protein
MTKHSFYLKALALFWAFSLLVITPSLALAEDGENEIDVEYPIGHNLNDDDIFDEENIYPGWSKKKDFSVENNSDESEVDLFLRIDLEDGEKLAKELKLYVIREDDNNYRIGGEGDRWDLEDADDEGYLYFDRLDEGEEEEYEIKIKFDEDAGNEFQGLETEFDIDFMVEGEEVTAGVSEEDVFASQGRVVTGEAPTDEITEEPEEEPEVQGQFEEAPELVDSQEDQQATDVKGTSSECVSWPPFWVWVVALVVIIISLIVSDYRNFRRREYGWKFDLFIVIAAILFWYFFDNCKIHLWFLFGSLASGVLIHAIYIALLKKVTGDGGSLPPIENDDYHGSGGSGSSEESLSDSSGASEDKTSSANTSSFATYHQQPPVNPSVFQDYRVR